MFRKIARRYLSTTARGVIRRLCGQDVERQEPSLNEKVNAYIARNRDRKLPEREEKLMPEIVVPCYKHGRFLEGLLKCTVPLGVPITIVNDRSPDDTDLRASELQKKYAFRYLYNEENINQSGSINRAVSTSQNNLFIILNADDLLMPYWPSSAIQVFKETDVRLMGGAAFTLHQECLAMRKIFHTS
jgi:hypothetical protein